MDDAMTPPWGDQSDDANSKELEINGFKSVLIRVNP
jgi:hypothetical protein